MDLTELTITQAHAGLKKKEFSSVDLTKAYLKKIKKEDDKIGAYLSVTEDLALEQAKEADAAFAKGYGAQDKKIGALMGIPCAIKDNILVDGLKCTNASKILENYIAPYDATAIKKLKESGAVILGKTNLDEFAFGSSTENSAFKLTRNPHDLERVAGGSSGGSAAAVASNQSAYALGTDTGCSIRTPASFCGVVGLKPTYGSVSRYGLTASASSLDQIGPITKDIEDCRSVFEAISGKDPMDATSRDYKFEKTDFDIKNLKIGVPKEYFAKGLDKNVEKLIKNAIKKAEDAGAEIIEISLPSSEYALACYYIIQTSEASANLARFDGIKYGLSQPADDLFNVYVKSRGEGLGREAKRRIMLGTYCLSSGYYDAYYKKAQEARELIAEDFRKSFDKIDLIFCPVTPFPAFKIGEKKEDPLSMYLADIYTVSVNLAGLPALSMPVGKIAHSTGSGLPVGLQIIGNHFQENKILAAAAYLENNNKKGS